MRFAAVSALLLSACAAGAPVGTGDDDDPAPPDAAPGDPDAAGGAPDAAPTGVAPAVIVLIGDGMGAGQLDAASLYAHGATGELFLQSLPHAGQVRTGGPSGITDSAAAATVMATGVYTYNGNVGVDRAEQPVTSLVERARAAGWATGVVSTASIAHATPAAFTAHVDARGDYAAIAAQQATEIQPDVMLGGGAAVFAPFLDELSAAGYAIVDDAAGLAAAAPTATRLFGAFAPEHLTYVTQRPPASTEPTLVEQAQAALAVLDRDPDGFFLMIEGGRIDMASHGNDLANTVHETLAFDATVAEVVAWARARGNTTVLVTADHECGGLEIVTPPAAAGTLPEVRWRWNQHTNARVAVYGDGPGTEVVDDAVIDHRWIHAIAAARIDGAAFTTPGREAIPDGELADLRHRAVVQSAPTGFGAGFNQLDALWLDAAPHGLLIGVEGVFEWDANAVQIWIDVDHGAGTGPAGLAGAVRDDTGVADAVLRASSVAGPGISGFGVDVVVVSVGGADPHVEDSLATGGARGLRAPYGSADDLGWLPAAINFGAVRVRGTATASVPGQGLEAFVPWETLYPAGVPADPRVAVAAVLVNTDGGFTSNQLLPPLGPAAANPGRAVTPLPGIVVYELDSDADGTIDGAAAPQPVTR